MKPSCSSFVVVLCVLLATCSGIPFDAPVGDELTFAQKYGYIRESGLLQGRTDKNKVCQTNEVYKVFKAPPFSGAASSFCSQYIRPTSRATSTATKVSVSTQRTTTTTTEVTTTVASATVATITELCATPTASVTCAFEAFGFGSFLISSASGVSGLECHRRCLLDPTCESFQVQTGGNNICNLFNAPTAGNVQPAPNGGFVFYDRDCTDLLPAGCAIAPARKSRRGSALLPWMPVKPASYVSVACTCLITAAPPATTITVVVPTTTITTTTDISITTMTSVQTDTIEVTYVTYTTVP
ncbi:hypothetical protein VTL71DRAFT_3649 [Oculimacula yallundae]|uniref:Apple domain-containing protein n=1 Tax=Oculimacula yallundae TaxID=86028 RepID=A0ABR4C470_9HELO